MTEREVPIDWPEGSTAWSPDGEYLAVWRSYYWRDKRGGLSVDLDPDAIIREPGAQIWPTP